jgi:hypothetical protein
VGNPWLCHSNYPPASVNPVHNAPVGPSPPVPPLVLAPYPVFHRALPSPTPKTLHREQAVIGIFQALPTLPDRRCYFNIYRMENLLVWHFKNCLKNCYPTKSTVQMWRNVFCLFLSKFGDFFPTNNVNIAKEYSFKKMIFLNLQNFAPKYKRLRKKRKVT